MARHPQIDPEFLTRVWATSLHTAKKTPPEKKDLRPFYAKREDGGRAELAYCDIHGRLFWNLRYSDAPIARSLEDQNRDQFQYIRHMRKKSIGFVIQQVGKILTAGWISDIDAEILLDLLYIELNRRTT